MCWHWEQGRRNGAYIHKQVYLVVIFGCTKCYSWTVGPRYTFRLNSYVYVYGNTYTFVYSYKHRHTYLMDPNAQYNCRELFQDGYDEHGNRVYDKVHGLTCHQCRQKTIGLRTECSKCNSLVGNFCGDCLFMRYGENIEETLGRNDWVCPPCRDLCNCSFHRTRKGWAPTGTLYRRAIAEGFPSVAHYLVLTNLKDEDTKRKALPYMPKHLKEEILQELKYTNDDRNCQGDSTKENAKENYACICI